MGMVAVGYKKKTKASGTPITRMIRRMEFAQLYQDFNNVRST
jgi:hypothetical protein